MPVSVDTIAKLMAAGVTGEALIEVARAIEEDIANQIASRDDHVTKSRDDAIRTKKAQDAERAREYRARKKPSRDALARVDDSSSKKDTSGERKNKGTPRDELGVVLDPEHTTAVIEHRNRMRKPLTPYAAKLLAQKLRASPDPNAAADLMIEKGWQSFEPHYLDGQTNRPNGTGPPATPSNRKPIRDADDYLAELERAKNEKARSQTVSDRTGGSDVREKVDEKSLF